jgi:hypothetical protein
LRIKETMNDNGQDRKDDQAFRSQAPMAERKDAVVVSPARGVLAFLGIDEGPRLVKCASCG